METKVEHALISPKMSLTHILNETEHPCSSPLQPVTSMYRPSTSITTTISPIANVSYSRHTIHFLEPRHLQVTRPPRTYLKYPTAGATPSPSPPPPPPPPLRVRKDTTCKRCCKSFKTKQGLSRHYFTVHLKQRPFKCNDCNATFGQKCSLQRHRRSVHNKEDCNFVCEHSLCALVFVKYSALQSHIKAQHNGEYPFRCHHPNCSKTFMWSSSYKSHEETVHCVASTSSEAADSTNK